MDVTNTENRRLKLIEDIKEEEVYYHLAALSNAGFKKLNVSFSLHLDLNIIASVNIYVIENRQSVIVNKELFSNYFTSLCSTKFKEIVDPLQAHSIVFIIDLVSGNYKLLAKSHIKRNGVITHFDHLKNNYSVRNRTKTCN